MMVLNRSSTMNSKGQSLLFESCPEEARAFSCSEALINCPCRLYSCQIYSPVEEEHNKHRKEEGSNSRVEYVTLDQKLLVLVPTVMEPKSNYRTL